MSKTLLKAEYFSKVYQHIRKFQVAILIIDGVADIIKFI